LDIPHKDIFNCFTHEPSWVSPRAPVYSNKQIYLGAPRQDCFFLPLGQENSALHTGNATLGAARRGTCRRPTTLSGAAECEHGQGCLTCTSRVICHNTRQMEEEEE